MVKFPGYPFIFEMLTLVPTPNGYKIFMIASEFSSHIVWVYDSRVHSWREFQDFDPILSDNCHQGVYSNGVLYFCTLESLLLAPGDDMRLLPKLSCSNLVVQMPSLTTTTIELISNAAIPIAGFCMN